MKDQKKGKEKRREIGLNDRIKNIMKGSKMKRRNKDE